MTRRTVTGSLLAGVARAPHRVTAGMPIGPWGARATQTSTGVHKPLTVTALVLGQLDTGPAAVVIAIDTVSWPTDLGASVAEEVGAAVGVDPAAVFLAASHTHSGLSLDETYLAPRDPDGAAPASGGPQADGRDPRDCGRGGRRVPTRTGDCDPRPLCDCPLAPATGIRPPAGGCRRCALG